MSEINFQLELGQEVGLRNHGKIIGRVAALIWDYAGELYAVQYVDGVGTLRSGMFRPAELAVPIER